MEKGSGCSLDDRSKLDRIKMLWGVLQHGGVTVDEHKCRRRELTPRYYPLTSIYTTWHVVTCTYIIRTQGKKEMTNV